MLGLLQENQSWSQLQNYFLTTPFENAIIVSTDGRLRCIIEQITWRRSLLFGLPDHIMISDALTILDEREAAQQLSPGAQSPFNSRLPRLSPILDSNGYVQSSRPSLGQPDTRINASALIMAGGFGRRLGELTRSTPKPMLHVAGRPISEHLLQNITENGIQDIFFSLYHLPDVVRTHYEDGQKYGCRIRYTEEPRPLGTAGCISLLPADIATPLLVINGDLVTDLPLCRPVDFHIKHDNDLTVAVRPYRTTVPFGVIEHTAGAVTAIREKPVLNWSVNAAIYVLSRKAIDMIPPRTRIDMPELIERMLPLNMRVSVFPMVETWIDVGTPNELERARSTYNPAAKMTISELTQPYTILNS